MKTLKFSQNLIPLILDGSKTVTWRLFDDKNLKIGDRVEFIKSNTGEKFADAEIINICEKKLEEITDEDFHGHERYESKQEMLETYRVYYGDKVNWGTVIKIVEFKLLQPEK